LSLREVYEEAIFLNGFKLRLLHGVYPNENWGSH